MQNFMVGNIVESRMGHDRGRLYVIIALEGNFALVADGKRRKTESPKRKRLKHLKYAAVGRETEFTDIEIKRIIDAVE